MNDDQFKVLTDLLGRLETKLDVIVGVAIAQGKTQDEQILALKDRGFSWSAIGDIVGMKPNAARMRYSRISK